MKRTFLVLSTAVMLSLTACNQTKSDSAVAGDKQESAKQEGTEFTVDTTSIIKWQAAHKGNLMPRYGTLKINEGKVFVNEGAVTAGSFTIPLKSLWVDPASTNNDKDEKKSTDLAGHLLAADFFDAAKHPDVKFEITSVAAFDAAKDKSLLEGATNMVSGNLTIKDSTVNIVFPAKIAVVDKSVTVVAKFAVDRTSWGLSYGAKGDPKDWGIAKDIELNLNITATSK